MFKFGSKNFGKRRRSGAAPGGVLPNMTDKGTFSWTNWFWTGMVMACLS